MSNKNNFALVIQTKAGLCNIPSNLPINAPVENRSAIGNLYCVKFLMGIVSQN
ncbi:MAG: hypothetical protein IJ859_04785 [Synergistaceae bacterium]|nr:hypothetical protein [Synergistaceae bacterium]